MALRTRWVVPAWLIASSLVAAGVGADPPQGTNGRIVTEEIFDDGKLVLQRGYMDDDQELAFEVHIVHFKEYKGKPGGGADPGTDCESDNYKRASYRWTSPYSATASSHASVFNAAAESWDAATGANIFGSITSGSQGTAGQQDFVNQFDFVSLGSSSTIAVTTTWYFTGSGEAVESDAQYNTFYQWSTTGASNAMDVAAIGTHEIGHTFGLNHPNGSPGSIGCLTMYAYADFGQTHQRTLGDGDVLGIKAIYGA